MKNFIYIICLGFSTFAFSQDSNPDLYQTWYLYYLDADGLIYNIPDINPPISPYLTIEQNLEYNGEGACNSFDGVYTLPFPNSLESVSFSSTNDDCIHQSHISFEDTFFQLMSSGGDFEIFQDGQGMVLRLTLPIFWLAEFRNNPLSASDFDFNEIKIYPNPVSTILHIDSQNIEISSIEVMNISGEQVQEINGDFKSLNLTGLSSGIYLIKIYTEHGNVVKKIAKH